MRDPLMVIPPTRHGAGFQPRPSPAPRRPDREKKLPTHVLTSCAPANRSYSLGSQDTVRPKTCQLIRGEGTRVSIMRGPGGARSTPGPPTQVPAKGGCGRHEVLFRGLGTMARCLYGQVKGS